MVEEFFIPAVQEDLRLLLEQAIWQQSPAIGQILLSRVKLCLLLSDCD
jgi:hypothetical protein